MLLGLWNFSLAIILFARVNFSAHLLSVYYMPHYDV